jgi:PPOX class probable F420-dependent enzyme
MTVVDELGRSSYVSLTTFRKNGTAVPTPVWHVLTGGEIFIVTDADAGKVKRIRNNGRVVVTACNIRGKIKPGAPSAEGTARLLDEAETEAGRSLLARKYVMSRLGNWFTKVLRLRKRAVIGIAVTFSGA